MSVVAFAAISITRDGLVDEASLYAMEYFIIYALCLIGAAIKDGILAHKYKAKIDYISLFLYPVLCAFLVSAVFDLVETKVEIPTSTEVFIAVFSGIWSRELVALLMNNKLILNVTKIATKYALSKTKLSDEEKEELQNAFQSGVQDALNEDSEEEKSPESELSTPEDPPGEFEWDEIIE